jgi:hypothetical protein
LIYDPIEFRFYESTKTITTTTTTTNYYITNSTTSNITTTNDNFLVEKNKENSVLRTAKVDINNIYNNMNKPMPNIIINNQKNNIDNYDILFCSHVYQSLNLSTINDLVYDLYSKMRFEYLIEPDEVMFHVINSMFASELYLVKKLEYNINPFFTGVLFILLL